MICLLRVGFDDAEEPNEAPLSSVADRLGNYRIERHDDGTPWELGRGAMGITYRAVDTSLQRPVALKLIDSEWVKRGAEARERFMREARAAAALRHPNVATVYHFGIREENGQCFCAIGTGGRRNAGDARSPDGPLDALTTIDIALTGQQRTGHSGKARSRAPGFETCEFDGGRSDALAAFFFKRQRDEELAFIQEECDEGVASTRKGDRLRRGESTCGKAGCDGPNARRICWHAGFRESGAIH
jgi:serine/threonine protein kinase